MTHKLTIQVAAKHATSPYENSFDQWIRRGNIRVDDVVRLSFLVALATRTRLIQRPQVSQLAIARGGSQYRPDGQLQRNQAGRARAFSAETPYGVTISREFENLGNMGDLVRCWLLIERRPAVAASGYFTLLRCFGAIGSWGLALVPGRVYIAKVVSWRRFRIFPLPSRFIALGA